MTTTYRVEVGVSTLSKPLLRITQVKAFEGYPYELLRKLAEYPPIDGASAFLFLHTVAELSKDLDYQEGQGVAEGVAEAVVNAIGLWYMEGCPRFAEMPYFTLQNYNQAKLCYSTKGWWFEGEKGEWLLPNPEQVAANEKSRRYAMYTISQTLMDFVPRKEE